MKRIIIDLSESIVFKNTKYIKVTFEGEGRQGKIMLHGAKRWTKTQDRELAIAIKGRETTKALAIKLNRSTNALILRAKNLKFTGYWHE